MTGGVVAMEIETPDDPEKEAAEDARNTSSAPHVIFRKYLIHRVPGGGVAVGVRQLRALCSHTN